MPCPGKVAFLLGTRNRWEKGGPLHDVSLERDCKDKSSHFVYFGEDNVSMSAGSLAVLSSNPNLLPPLTVCLLAKALPSLLTTCTKAEPQHALGSYAALGDKKCSSECIGAPANSACLCTVPPALFRCWGASGQQQKPPITAPRGPCESGHKKGVSPGPAWLRFPSPARECPLVVLAGEMAPADEHQHSAQKQPTAQFWEPSFLVHFMHRCISHFLTSAAGNKPWRQYKPSI